MIVSTFTARIRCARLQRPDQLNARSASSLFVETVSDAIEGLDSIEGRVTGAEFAANALYVAVDGAVVDINVILIGNVEELVARLHHSRTLRESLEDQEFGDGQRHLAAVPQNLVPRRIHDQPPALEQRRLELGASRFGFALGQLLPPKDRANSSNQQAL